MASVAFTGVATLVIRFVAPARPTEIVLASSATEFKPIAVAPAATALLLMPNTLLRLDNARLPPCLKLLIISVACAAVTLCPLTSVNKLGLADNAAQSAALVLMTTPSSVVTPPTLLNVGV